MIDRSHPLPLTQQARELGLSRGSIYYLPRQVAAADLTIMRRIDELHMDYPFAGSRMLRDLLAGEGIVVGRLHVATLMKKDGDRGDLPATEYVEAFSRSQDLPVFAAQTGGNTAEPSLGD